MAEYLISFNDEWTGDNTDAELEAKSRLLRPLIAEMTERGVLVFTGGLLDGALCSVDAASGEPVFTEGPLVESEQHLGGFAVVEVADEAEARLWAGRIATACGWPQELRQFMGHRERAESAPS